MWWQFLNGNIKYFHQGSSRKCFAVLEFFGCTKGWILVIILVSHTCRGFMYFYKPFPLPSSTFLIAERYDTNFFNPTVKIVRTAR